MGTDSTENRLPASNGNYEHGDCPGGYELSLALRALDEVDQKAGSRTRGAIDQIWRLIAAGDVCFCISDQWAKVIAKRVTAAVIDDDKVFTSERSGRALRALGLYKREDANWHERRALELYLTLATLTASDGKEELGLDSPTNLLQIMRSQGFYKKLSDRAAKARIARLREEITLPG